VSSQELQTSRTSMFASTAEFIVDADVQETTHFTVLCKSCEFTVSMESIDAFPVPAPIELPPQHPPLGKSAGDWEVHDGGHIHQSEPRLISNLQHWRLLCRILGYLHNNELNGATKETIHTSDHIPVRGLL